jgi:RimJ/RimL family protein N-acetyltransferase
MTPFCTGRLRLEVLARGHAGEMFPVLSDPGIYQFLDYGPPESVDALRNQYIQLEAGRSPDASEVWLNWVVRLASGPAIGYVQATVYPGQKTYVGYVFAPGYWGQGYATEAMTALLLHLAHEHPTPVTMAVVEASNVRSTSLLRRLEFAAVPSTHPGAAGLTPTERLYVRPFVAIERR